MMTLENEKSLLKEAKKNPECFGEIFDHYYPLIYGFVLKRTNNVEVAQDIVSETFFCALKSLWRFKWTGKPFSAWLYKIATVQIAQFYRQKKLYCTLTLEQAPELIAHQETEADYDVNLRESDQETKELYDNLHVVLLKLPATVHTIIILKYFENKKIIEIASIMGLKENTVKSHLRRGLAKLEKLLVGQKDKNERFLNNFINYVQERTTQHIRE